MMGYRCLASRSSLPLVPERMSATDADRELLRYRAQQRGVACLLASLRRAAHSETLEGLSADFGFTAS